MSNKQAYVLGSGLGGIASALRAKKKVLTLHYLKKIIKLEEDQDLLIKMDFIMMLGLR